MKFIIMLFIMFSWMPANLFEFSNDYKEAIEQAQKENKDIYMLVTSDYCRWCRKFEDNTLSNDELIATMQKKFVLLHLSRGQDFIPEQYVAKKVPKHFFLTSKGEVIYSVLGYWNVEDFTSFVHDVENNK